MLDRGRKSPKGSSVRYHFCLVTMILPINLVLADHSRSRPCHEVPSVHDQYRQAVHVSHFIESLINI